MQDNENDTKPNKKRANKEKTTKKSKPKIVNEVEAEQCCVVLQETTTERLEQQMEATIKADIQKELVEESIAKPEIVEVIPETTTTQQVKEVTPISVEEIIQEVIPETTTTQQVKGVTSISVEEIIEEIEQILVVSIPTIEEPYKSVEVEEIITAPNTISLPLINTNTQETVEVVVIQDKETTTTAESPQKTKTSFFDKIFSKFW